VGAMTARRKLVCVAIGAGFAAAVLLLVGAVMVVQSFSLTPRVVDGSTSLDVTSTGTWLVASEQHARIDGADYTGSDVEPADITLVSPAGVSRDVEPLEQHIAYRTPDREGAVIGKVLIDRPGIWRLNVANHRSPVLLAMGPDPITAMTWWVFGAGSGAIVLLGIALGCGWVALRRPSPVHSGRGSPIDQTR
jgi:hypothetical protein